jgi:hypothetical protein
MVKTSTYSSHVTDRVGLKTSTCGLKLTVWEVEAILLLLKEDLCMKRDESFDTELVLSALPALLFL